MPTELIIKTLIKERQVLFQLKKELGILRGDLEVLAFGYSNMFFSLYDLRKHYLHTNIQQLSRSLQKLSKSYYIHSINKGSKGNPAVYCITPEGERLLNKYQAGFIELDVLTSEAEVNPKDNSLKSFIRYKI